MLAQMASIVPETNHRLGTGVLIPQNAQACGAQEKEPPGFRFQTEPAGSQHPQEMPIADLLQWSVREVQSHV